MRIRPMTLADLDLGMRLKEQTGWNQTEGDWRRYLRLQPDGCFVAEIDSVGAGTTACFVFGPVAWVAVVLVDEAVRGRGVGTALMRHALVFLDQFGIRTIRLDATPLGRPIYEKLGFVADHTVARYSGVLAAVNAGVNEVEELAVKDLDEVVALDEAVTGAKRGRLLSLLYEECPEAFRVVRRGEVIEGFVASRPGANARQIGPCLGSSAAGPMLLADAQRQYAGHRVFIDVPLPNALSVSVVEAMGLQVQRHLLRMTRGSPTKEVVERLWASSGPEKG